MKKKFIITLNEKSLADLDNVLHKLENFGMKINAKGMELAEMGILSAQASEKISQKILSTIKKLKEIDAIEEEEYTQLPPPDSEIM